MSDERENINTGTGDEAPVECRELDSSHLANPVVF
jgi:hypothetical protein